MSKKIKRPEPRIIMALDPMAVAIAKAEAAGRDSAPDEGVDSDGTIKKGNTVLGSILESLHKEESKMVRMSFEADPKDLKTSFGSLYRLKSNLVPDHIIKRISGPQGDDLICAILQARSNMIGSFGRPRTSRFAVGFEFQEINKGMKVTKEEREKDKEKLEKLKEIIWNCGSKKVDDEYFSPNFATYLKMITRDSLAYGRFATEFMHTTDPTNGKRKLVAWRPADAGTIYRVSPKREKDQSARAKGISAIQDIKNEKLDPSRFEADEYRYVQVINGTPEQGFTEEEMVVYNMYPVTNVEYNGYPLTPIDQTLNAITTHINITIHNRLYFQHGRASRGILVFKSDDIDESVLQKIRLQFHQSINSVQNSWRMPVFGVGPQDDVTFQSIDVAGRDAEFQYLSDSNARVILSAFQMSPEELPGYAHLARGTNTQALAEADNEWKLTAARDVGLRPLLYDVQDFLNTHILPKLDLEISKRYQLVLAGLDKDSPEKESTRLQQDMPIHMTMNDVLKHVEKREIPREMGGDLPFNPQYRQTLDQYFTVGQIMEFFCGVEGASKDPRFNYVRDPLWLQWQQLMLQKAQMSMQAQMAQQQASQPPPQEDQPPPGATEEQKAEVAKNNLQKKEEWLKNNHAALDKAIRDNHDQLSKVILAHHKEVHADHLKRFKKDSEIAISKITAQLAGHGDKK